MQARLRPRISGKKAGTNTCIPIKIASNPTLRQSRATLSQNARISNFVRTKSLHNFPLEFLRHEVPLNAFSLPSEAKVRYLADSLKSLCDLSRTTKPLEIAIDYLDALQKEAEEQNHGPRHDGGLLSHNNNHHHHNLLLISRMKEVIQNAIHTG